MSEKSSSSGSDDDVDPESGHPVELGGILSKVPWAEIMFSQLKTIVEQGVVYSVHF